MLRMHIMRCAIVFTYAHKFVIEIYWNMCNNHSEKTTGWILAGYVVVV